MSAEQEQWYADNQRHLAAELALVRHYLRRHAGAEAGDEAALRAAASSAAVAVSPQNALDSLAESFGLSLFERAVVVMCAGVDLAGDFAADCAAAQGAPDRAYPTFGLALAAFPDAHWTALIAEGPLRRWRIVEVVPGDTLTSSPLRLDERILHHLAGAADLDTRLAGIVTPVGGRPVLAPSHEALADELVAVWSTAAPGAVLPVVEIEGGDPSAALAVTSRACELTGFRLHAARGPDLPANAGERDALAILCEREAILSRAVLLLQMHDAEAEAVRNATALVERMGCPVVVATTTPVGAGERPGVRLHAPAPQPAEQRSQWEAVLGPLAAELNGRVEAVASQFRLTPSSLRAAGAELSARAAAVPDGAGRAGVLAEALWDVCRRQARRRLDDLAERIVSGAGWDDLVLPEGQRATLREVALHVGHRARVYETWGFGLRSRRGLGISALFSGPSGTGKTLAAEVLANELRLDLYKVDLSQVVSKYIGETEKNLKRVFDAAEGGSAVLLFDEADALFGKRSEIKDSHDRFANIEVSYLLQRMEAYEGLAILTTNMKSALDTAFLRRIRFVVQFPFPEAAQREEIWRRVFPATAPVEPLEWDRLARLNVAGGSIRNIALNAAFLAAGDGTAVTMSHLLRATRTEYAKLEKPLTAAEAGGWR